MPYIRKGNSVYKQDTGKLVGTSSSPTKAKAYMRALYANTKDETKSTKPAKKPMIPFEE